MKTSFATILVILISTVAFGEPPDRSLLDVQTRLNELGYEAGAADGALGPATQKAIRNFQRVVGLEPTGDHDAELELHLFQSCQLIISAGPGGGFSFVGHPAGGCHKPEHVEGNDYLVCIRDSGDCSVPGPNGVTDSMVVTLDSALE